MWQPQETLKDVEDAFDILGLGLEATEDAVTKQYRKLMLKYHPDKNLGREEEAKAQFDNVQKARDLLDRYFKNRESFLPGPSRRATSIDPFDTGIPRGTNVQRETRSSGGEHTRYYGPDDGEFVQTGGVSPRIVHIRPPGVSESEERSSRERNSHASRSNEHRRGRRESSVDRAEVREDGANYIKRTPTNTEPATSHKKKGSAKRPRGQNQFFLVRDKKTGKTDLGVRR